MAAWNDEQIARLREYCGFDPNSPVRLAHLALAEAQKRKRAAYKEFEQAVLAVEQARADYEFLRDNNRKNFN